MSYIALSRAYSGVRFGVVSPSNIYVFYAHLLAGVDSQYDNARPLIMKMLLHDPVKRPTSFEVSQQLAKLMDNKEVYKSIKVDRYCVRSISMGDQNYLPFPPFAISSGLY